MSTQHTLTHRLKIAGTLLCALIITLWFPLTRSWSDFHNFVFSVSTPNELYSLATYKPFYLLPWAIPILYPFTFIPSHIGWIIFNTLSLWGIWESIKQFDRSPNFTVLLTCFLSFFYILFASIGQWDGVILAFVGVALYALRSRKPYLLGVALLMLTTKPVHVWMVGLLFLYAVRDWPWGDLLRMLAMPSLAVLTSLMVSPTWPLDYLMFIQDAPPFTILGLSFTGDVSIPLETLDPSLWLMGFGLLLFGLHVYVGFRDFRTAIACALCANLILGTYLQIYHFILLIPMLILLGKEDQTIRVTTLATIIILFPLAILYLPSQTLGILPLVFLSLSIFVQLRSQAVLKPAASNSVFGEAETR